MNRTDAVTLATRISASYPSSRIGKETLAEWADELEGLSTERGGMVLDWLRGNVETAPSFRQIRLAIHRTGIPKPGPRDWKEPTAGLDSACEFCGHPIPPGPDAASRYDPTHDRWFNAHVGCADAQPGSRAN